jgi:alanine dehydrogenase
MTARSLGLPGMHKEAGEKRAFLPGFVEKLAQYDIQVVLEHDYGRGMDINPLSYTKANPKARFGTLAEAYNQDIVMVLRFPSAGELDLLKPGSILVSMIHYETRPDRIENLVKRNITGVSLDAVKDDNDQRLVENIAGTAWNGMNAAFQALLKDRPWFISAKKPYLTVTIIGMGAVGMHAARAASKYGNLKLYETSEQRKIPGVLVQCAGRSITRDHKSLEDLFKATDILADTSKRNDPTVPIIRNHLIGCLPKDAVILDLTADPYDFDTRPYQVKGIEGIPTGSLDGYIFETDHPVYLDLGKYIDAGHRRVVASCNAWPGVTPNRCMDIYGRQIGSFFPVLFTKPVSELNVQSDNLLERALARSTLGYFLKQRPPSGR